MDMAAVRVRGADQHARSRDRLYDSEIRKVLCSTTAIESLNAQVRWAVRARGHFPSEQTALKTLYLVTRSLDSRGTGQARQTMRREPALNAFAVNFAACMPAAEDRTLPSDYPDRRVSPLSVGVRTLVA